MKHTRIPFMDALVRATMAGDKWVTRRPLNGSPTEAACRYGTAGDELWVCEGLRRTLWTHPSSPLYAIPEWVVSYSADGSLARRPGAGPAPVAWTWKNRSLPARYCPDGLVRTRLPIVSVRPERLRDVTDAEAVAEGLAYLDLPPTAEAYVGLWSRMYGTGPDEDPWMWRIEYERQGRRTT